MLQDEVRNLLNKLEKELLDFVQFIKNVEQDHDVKSEKHRVKKQEKSKTISVDDSKVAYGSAIVDSFNIVKNLLLRISNLIDVFASTPAENVGNIKNSDSYLITLYYSQYVYQISSYLVKLLEENLGKFSERLDYLASPKAQIKSSNFTSPKKKEISICSNVRQFRQEILSHQDDRNYKHPQTRNYKFGLKTFPTAVSSNSFEVPANYICSCAASSYENVYHLYSPPSCCTDDDDERTQYNRAEHDPLSRKGKDGGGIQEKLNHLRNLIKELDSVVENLLLHARETGSCCAETCPKCCESCKHEHDPPKFKTIEKKRKEWHEWDPNMLPDLTSDPLFMQMNPGAVNNNANRFDSDRKMEEDNYRFEKSSQTGSTTPHSRTKSLELKVPGMRDIETQYRSRSTDSYTCDIHHCFKITDNCEFQQAPNGVLQNKRVERIQPGQHTKELSTGELSRKSTPKKQSKKQSTKHQRSPPARLSNKVKRPLGLESFSKRDRKSHKIDSFEENCLLNHLSSEDDNDEFTEDFQNEKEGICTETDLLVDNIHSEYTKYPQIVVFNIQMFSRMLKDKFKKHFSSPRAMSENSEIVLDILFECMDESVSCKNIEETIDDSEISEYEKSDTGAEKFDLRSDMTLDTLMNEIMKATTQATDDVEEEEIFSPLNDRIIQSSKREKSQACESCARLIHPRPIDSENEKYPAKKTLKGNCFRCWYKSTIGFSIHQCHYTLPSGILEIRHMGKSGKICVCYLRWDWANETVDWRWKKSPFHDPTRVELFQQASSGRDTVVKVIYGPGGNMVKESLAETHLRTVNDNPYVTQFDESEKISSKFNGPKYVSISWLDLLKGSKLGQAKKNCLKSQDSAVFKSTNKDLLTKVGRFFDELQYAGYGRGPPLVLKLRRRTALKDAHNLLMAPSKISLNYYRNLRVIFISDKESIEPTTTNFIDEDESDELFSLFARKLFSPSDMHLFEYPSEETQFLYLNSEANMHNQWFEFAGAVLGLAILHQKQLDVSLAMCLLKCLLDRPLDINDLKEIDPLFYQRLKWIKEHDISSRKEKFCTFTVKDKIGGQVLVNELIPDGNKIAVTENNKYKYIDLAVKWKLAERCLRQLKDFRKGFATVLEPSFLRIFSEKELQNLIKHPLDSETFLSECSEQGTSNELTRRGTY